MTPRQVTRHAPSPLAPLKESVREHEEGFRGVCLAPSSTTSGAHGLPREDAHLGTQREGPSVRVQPAQFVQRTTWLGAVVDSTFPVVVVTRTVKRTGPATVLGDVVVSCRQCRAGLSSLLSALARRPGHTHTWLQAVDRATEMWGRHAEGLQEGRLPNPAVSRAKSEVDCV